MNGTLMMIDRTGFQSGELNFPYSFAFHRSVCMGELDKMYLLCSTIVLDMESTLPLVLPLVTVSTCVFVIVTTTIPYNHTENHNDRTIPMGGNICICSLMSCFVPRYFTVFPQFFVRTMNYQCMHTCSVLSHVSCHVIL